MRAVLLCAICAACAASAPTCPPSAAICEDTGTDLGAGKADGGDTVRVPWRAAIVVVGVQPAVDLVIADLDAIEADPIGAVIIDRLEAAAALATTGPDDQRVILRARDDTDPTALTFARTMFGEGWLARSLPVATETDAQGRVIVTSPGTRVPPGEIRIYYDRKFHQEYDDGTPCFVIWFELAHELTHAVHGMSGTVLAGFPDPTDPMPGGSNHEEAWTIGRGAYLGDSPTENAIRAAHGVPVRDSHGSLCGPR